MAQDPATYSNTKLYIRPWGSSSAFTEFSYNIGGVNTIPPYDATQNDMDKDTYTNTKGKLVRNKIRDNVKTLEFNIPVMSGTELKNFFTLTKNKTWLEVKFFDEVEWGIATKKMYRSATVKYHKEFIHETNPLLNVYTNVEFSLIEE